MKHNNMSRVAVIILNWNGEKLLREFLPSVVRNTDTELGKVYVVDNCSTDSSIQVMADEFPDVEVVRFDENYGFAGGYNRAVDLIEAEYIVLLNSDVEVTPGWLLPMMKILDEDKRIGAVQPKIRAYREKQKFEYAGACGGYIDHWGFPYCRGRILDVTEEDNGQYDDIVDVAWCSGAALFIRREAYLHTGGLDERFFAHMEEIDLCWRLRNAGYLLKVVPDSVVYHLGGGSLPMNHPRKLFLNYRNNLLMLYKNLDTKERRRVFAGRKMFDLAALCLFMLKGELHNVKAVIRAYREYGKMKRSYQPGTGGKKTSGMSYLSIILAYYLRGKRTFSALK